MLVRVRSERVVVDDLRQPAVGLFSIRMRRSSFTTSRSRLKSASLMRSVAMRSASIHNASGRYCAGNVCQNTVSSSVV
jgi:hypothetical protein